MDHERKIKNLQEKIDALSSGITTSMQQLRGLQTDLDNLKAELGYKPVAAPIAGNESQRVAEPRGLESFIGLKLIHLVGIVVLVIGISIGVKYAIDRQMISEALRVLLAYAAGIFLFVLSVRLKKNYALFSAILFSGGMASIYFTTYAAAVYYYFLPALVAFILMAGLTVYTAYMSLVYDRKEIAIIGMIGAYGIPFLISANAERMYLFFSYILLINIGVVFLYFKKGWRILNTLALLITWVLFLGWGLVRFDATQLYLAALFMVSYFLLFLCSTARFQTWNNGISGYYSILLLFLNNVGLYFGALILFYFSKPEFDPAVVTGCFVILTAIQAFLSWKLFPNAVILQRMFTLFSLVVLLLFITIKWEGLAVTLLWVAISVMLFAWGIWWQKSWARLSSVLLIGVTLLKLLIIDAEKFSTLQKIASYIIIGILLLLFSFYYQKLGLLKKQEK